MRSTSIASYTYNSEELTADMCAVVRLALEKESKKIANNARNNLTQDGSVRTGLLRKSVDSKSIVLTRKGAPRVWAGVGINKKIYGAVNGKSVKPTKYAHLVEYGHMSPHGWVSEKPFMRKAVAVAKTGMDAVVAEAFQKGAYNALG